MKTTTSTQFLKLNKETLKSLATKTGVQTGKRYHTDACHSALNTQCCH